jgi:hypothetical protein
MAALDFPDIEPSSRVFNPGEFPRTLFESQNGAVTAVYFGYRPVNSTLELTFRNIVDDKAHQIVNHYKRCNRADGDGNWNYAKLPTTATGPLAGIGDAELRSVVGENEDNRRYRYESAPVVTSTFPGYSTVVVKLVGMMEAAGARID